MDEESSVERIYLLLRPDLPLEGPTGAGMDGGGDVLAHGWRVCLLVGAAKVKKKKKKKKKKTPFACPPKPHLAPQLHSKRVVAAFSSSTL